MRNLGRPGDEMRFDGLLWARCGFAFVFFSGLVVVHCGAPGFYSLGSSGLWRGPGGRWFPSLSSWAYFLGVCGLGTLLASFPQASFC